MTNLQSKNSNKKPNTADPVNPAPTSVPSNPPKKTLKTPQFDYAIKTPTPPPEPVTPVKPANQVDTTSSVQPAPKRVRKAKAKPKKSPNPVKTPNISPTKHNTTQQPPNDSPITPPTPPTPVIRSLPRQPEPKTRGLRIRK